MIVASSWVFYMSDLSYSVFFLALSQNCERLLLASSDLSVCRQGKVRLPQEWFLWNMLFEYFSKICVALYGIEWKKYGTAGQATDDNILRRVRIACWISKVIITHSEYVILIAFPQQPSLRKRVSMSRLYVHCLSCFFHGIPTIVIWKDRDLCSVRM